MPQEKEIEEANARLSVNVSVLLAKRILVTRDNTSFNPEITHDSVYDFLDDILTVFNFIPNLGTSGIKKMQVGVLEGNTGFEWIFLLNNGEKCGTVMKADPEFFVSVLENWCNWGNWGKPEDKDYLISELGNFHKQLLRVDF
jgi:hypothetical protein